MAEIRESTLSRTLVTDATESARPARALSVTRRLRDTLTRSSFGLITVLVCVLLLALAGTLVARSGPLLRAYPLGELLSGLRWLPHQGLFGFAPFIVGSVVITGLAMLMAVPPAILSGIYLAEYTSRRTRNFLKPILDLLVGIPSVVYGLWGVLFIVPLVRDHLAPWSSRALGPWLPVFQATNPSGYSILAASAVLAIMVYPFIVAVTDEVLRTVPQGLRESLLALGTTRWEATKLIVRRAVPGGIIAAVVLGFSRAFGETLAVMMVSGNVAQIPRSLFDAGYSLPALIANNYGEMMSVPLYESALMMAAMILLGVVLVFNLLAAWVVRRFTRSVGS